MERWLCAAGSGLKCKGTYAYPHNSASEKFCKILTFLGDMFDGVQCPCILLQLIATGKPLSTVGMRIEDRTRTYTIAMERTVVPENFSFRMTDEEYRVLEKIKNSIPSVIW